MAKKKFYAVKVGKVPGIYSTWSECEEQVKGFPSASYKSFATLSEAENFMLDKGMEKLDSDKARKEKAYHLTGSVREQGERPYPDPLPDVNIQLYSLPDTSFIEGTVSDKKGVFRLYPMNPGNYLIRASFSLCAFGSQPIAIFIFHSSCNCICFGFL